MSSFTAFFVHCEPYVPDAAEIGVRLGLPGFGPEAFSQPEGYFTQERLIIGRKLSVPKSKGIFARLFG